MEMIKTVGLHKSFGALHVLTGVNQTIQKGEVVSIIGPSGGGKSTFLRCLNLLEMPEQGQIFFEGTEITGNPAPGQPAPKRRKGRWTSTSTARRWAWCSKTSTFSPT